MFLRRFLLQGLFVLVGFLLLLSLGYAQTEECLKAVDIYNRACDIQDEVAQERLFKQALATGCSDKGILAKIQNNLGDSLEKQGRNEEAVACYQRAIEADGSFSTPYLSLGDIYAKLNRKKEAAEFHEKGFFKEKFRSPENIVDSLSPKRSIKAVPRLDLYFGLNRVYLSEEAQRQLDALTDALNSDELLPYHFSLDGHTCSTGSTEYNRTLSERRARAVVEWLKSHGIDQRRLMAQGFGEERPVGDNNTEEGKRLNRRVEIRMVGVLPGIQLRTTRRTYNRALELLEEGKDLVAKERYHEALKQFREALELFKREKASEGIYAALEGLDLTYRYLGDWENAEVCRESILKAETR